MANLYREERAERHTSLSLVVRHIWASGRQWASLARSLWWHRGDSLLELEVRTRPSSLAGSRHSKNARRGGVKWGVWEDRVGQGLCTDGQLISDFRKGKGVLWFPLPPPPPPLPSNGDWTSCLVHLGERSTTEPHIWKEYTPYLIANTVKAARYPKWATV